MKTIMIRLLTVFCWAATLLAQDSLHVTFVGSYDTPGYAYGVAMAGNYAYVADHFGGLRVIDITNPDAPIEAGFYNTPGTAYAVTVSGNYAYVATLVDGLRIIDVTNPAALTEMGSCITVGHLYDVAVAGHYAYLAAHSMGLRVIDVANPSNPVEVGYYDTHGYTHGVVISGNYAYLADQGHGLRVLDISNPSNPTEVGFYDADEGYCNGVALAGNYAYLADDYMGLRVVNISNPSSPFESGFYQTQGAAQHVAVDGNYAYVAVEEDGLCVIDVANPSSPIEVGFYNTPGYANRIAVAGDYAHVADMYQLGIYDISYFTRGLQMLWPNGGETLQIFASEIIQWAWYDSTIVSVQIELNRDYPVGEWETLVDMTENDGEWTWLVTDPPSDNCRVQVCAGENLRCDVSDADFSILSSQGFLALIRAAQPNTPVLNWNPGTVECGDTLSEDFYLKNLGNESLVFQVLEPTSADFSNDTDCEGFVSLLPGEMSVCSLELNFHPTTEDGVLRDTLRIQTDAMNGVGGYIRLPLSGVQITTPAVPEVVIQQVGQSVRLSWDPVEESIGGCPITITHYLVFYSPTSEGPYYYNGGTIDTTYLHPWVIQYAPGQFYQITATMAPIPLLQTLPQSPGIMTREEVLERLKR